MRQGAQRHIVAAIIPRGNRLLMVRRATTESFPGKWCFPGGTVEPGETSRSAVVREVREEVGLTIIPKHRVWRWADESRHRYLEIWATADIQGTPRPSSPEVQDIKWMTVDEIRRSPEVLSNNIEFLDFARDAGLPIEGIELS